MPSYDTRLLRRVAEPWQRPIFSAKSRFAAALSPGIVFAAGRRGLPPFPKVIWLGPFPAPDNGISEYFERITELWRGYLNLGAVRLQFNNYPPDYPVQVVRAAATIARMARENPACLLHIQYCPFSTGPGAAVVAGLARALRLRIVTTIHEERLIVKSHPLSGVYTWVEDALLRLSDAIVVHSEGQRDRLPALAREKAAVIEFGIDPCFDRLKEYDPTAPVIGCFGQLAPAKGVETVIDACAGASLHLPNLRLKVMGSVRNVQRYRSYAAWLRSYGAERLGSRFEIHFNVPAAEFDQAYHEVDVLCFGLRHATQSTTFYRAIGHLRPVVVTDVGGVAEITRREGLGLVVPVDDPQAMAKAIVTIFAAEGAFDSLRAKAEAYATRRSWQANAEEHWRLYGQITRPRWRASTEHGAN